MNQYNYVNSLIKEIGSVIKDLGQDFYFVGSLVDIIYLDIEKKLKDVDIVYFGPKDIKTILPNSTNTSGLILGEKSRAKIGSVWVEIFTEHIKNPYNHISLYDINIQTAKSRYDFITKFLEIEEKSNWTSRYRSWFRNKKYYFNLVKSKYEYNIID